MVIVIIAMIALLVINFISRLPKAQNDKVVSRNDVRGIDVEHTGELWTLNFDQQNQLITILNNNPYNHEANGDRIIIYRFNAPDLVIASYNEIENVKASSYQ